MKSCHCKDSQDEHFNILNENIILQNCANFLQQKSEIQLGQCPHSRSQKSGWSILQIYLLIALTGESFTVVSIKPNKEEKTKIIKNVNNSIPNFVIEAPIKNSLNAPMPKRLEMKDNRLYPQSEIA